MIIFSVALGGAIGAVLRYGIGLFINNVSHTVFPLGTLSVNVLGSFLMGALVTYMTLSWNPSPEIRAFLMVGLLGGFTTFSAFSLEAVQLWERGAMIEMIGYVLSSVLLSILGLIFGAIIMKQIIS